MVLGDNRNSDYKNLNIIRARKKQNLIDIHSVEGNRLCTLNNMMLWESLYISRLNSPIILSIFN